jgi:drug/metabolite transporter (DMT)-like permease
MILIIIHYALFALTLITTKLIFVCCKPIFYTAARFTLAGALMMTYQYLYTKESFRIKKEHLGLFFQISFIGIYITYIIRFWGFLFMTSAKSMFMFNLAPFATALFSYVLLNERMTWKQWLGLAIAFIGFVPILKTSAMTMPSSGPTPLLSLPEIAVLASVAGQSYAWILIKKLIRETNYSSTLINGTTMFVGGLFAFATAPFFEGWYPVTNTMDFIQLLLFVIVIGNLICQNLYTYLLKTYTNTFLSFAGFMSPFFAAFYGWVWFGETTTWEFYASSVIVFVGLALFYQDELKNIKRQKEETEIPEMIEG